MCSRQAPPLWGPLPRARPWHQPSCGLAHCHKVAHGLPAEKLRKIFVPSKLCLLVVFPSDLVLLLESAQNKSHPSAEHLFRDCFPALRSQTRPMTETPGEPWKPTDCQVSATPADQRLRWDAWHLCFSFLCDTSSRFEGHSPTAGSFLPSSRFAPAVSLESSA